LADSLLKGQLARLTGMYHDAQNNPVDPDGVECKVRDGAGACTTYRYPAQIVREYKGMYWVDVSLTVAGAWAYRWSSTGEFQTAGEDSFQVLPGQFA
jgi:hypothetical protein